ncbi:LANO_0F12948g1_1 [Lachancea nothofagi CBS 11611]|uniref:LANO_0F12948g1_1 n=1 Tax=Lachancea nothofagi CBS 11611 TaxID=1266666 RepID=A0A1G4KBL5_9SACH|nr:LANO_0F12948g1_1 [Lachancea nothofagi CBS 11611]
MEEHLGTHKPRLIILVRHGESASNKDKSVNQHVPNHLISLTDNGWRQARRSGAELLQLLNVDDPLIVEDLAQEHIFRDENCKPLEQSYAQNNKNPDSNIVFYTSPYRRTRETLRGMLDVLDEYNERNCGVSARQKNGYQPNGQKRLAHWQCPEFPHGYFENTESRELAQTLQKTARNKNYVHYRVKDEPRIREQDFGNFQELSSMRDVMNMRKNYGHFFFRFPQGESAADVYDRCASFQETLFRHFNQRDRKPRDVVVLVTHGIYLRVFLMKWFRWTYEEFEAFTNVPNGSLVVMELDPELDRYALRTTMPRWR